VTRVAILSLSGGELVFTNYNETLGGIVEMFKKLRRSGAAHRLAEEQLYEAALTELNALEMRGGLWAKALADGAGDEQKARGLYLKYRVQSMIDEAEVTAGFAEDSVKNAEEHSASISTPRKSTHGDFVIGTKDNSHVANGQRVLYIIIFAVFIVPLFLGLVRSL
jgi:hypothetical protein